MKAKYRIIQEYDHYYIEHDYHYFDIDNSILPPKWLAIKKYCYDGGPYYYNSLRAAKATLKMILKDANKEAPRQNPKYRKVVYEV